MKQTYFTTGEFAKLCGTTKETLRHYNNIGLLKPARTSYNGYRYYSAFQFYDYYFIDTFKNTGMHLKDLKEKLAETDEKVFCNTLKTQLAELQREKAELLKKEKLLKRSIEKFDYLYEGDRIGQLELYPMEEEYYIATPVKGNAENDKVWMETIRKHINYCRENCFDMEYQLTYCWNMDDMLRNSGRSGWSICSQIDSPVDDPHCHIKPKGIYACILLRGYNFSTGYYARILEEIRSKNLRVLGNAYEADVSMFSPGLNTEYLTEVSIRVE